MKNVLTPQQTLSNSYRSEAVDPKDYKKYEESLNNLMEKPLDNVNDKKEANVEDYVRDFLKEAYDDYGKKYSISKKRNIDYVIFHDTIEKDPAVLLEFKRPSEKKDMCSYTDANNYIINVKALQQLLYYFVQERNNGSNRIQHLIICNGLEWYIFEATLMNRLFYEDSEFKNICLNYSNNEMTDNSTSSAFEAIERLIEPKLDKIQFTYLNLKTLKSDTPQTTKTQYYKIISPRHLLNIKSADSTYGLDKGFYKELLYIMGLEEKKEKGKTLITRLKKSDRKVGSLIELAIRKIESKSNLSNLNNIESYGETKEDQIFGISLQLVIIWINRILFLKLLEAQLSSYHVGTHIYSFMDFSKVTSFDVLETLFFEVLNKKQNERNDVVKDKYSHIPYLNSSLFEESQIENDTISISNLSDETNLSYIDNTVLKNKNSFDKNKEILTLNYLLDFLNSYDFYTESKEKIQSENKALIRANVLGLIFEKINGYKDGSFYTPGFITEYMCRETIRRTVVQKFNEKFDWNIEHFEDLFNKIDRLDDIEKANQVVNSITICDPAVGSGHFLVSALNEIILIKYELGIFCDVNNRRLVNYWQVEISDDELLFKNKINGNFFHYEVKEDGYINDDMQRLQKAIFHEKKTIIENCLFGVDINPNSVNICRLRLWIELLKHAYYKNDNELETLPNIDINIKCGNSLITKGNSNKNLSTTILQDRGLIITYKLLVDEYKNLSQIEKEDKKTRRQQNQLIDEIKSKITGPIGSQTDNENKLDKISFELLKANNDYNAFNDSIAKQQRYLLRLKLEKEINELRIEVEKEAKLLLDEFNWRIEFPEILDNDGNFIGFDIVIGNPPYFSISKLKKLYFAFKKMEYSTFEKTADIYCIFFERGIRILKENGHLCFITSNKWMRAGYGKNLRHFLSQLEPKLLIDLGSNIFDNATVDTNLIMVKNSKVENHNMLTYTIKEYKDALRLSELKFTTMSRLESDSWVIMSKDQRALINKIETVGKPLKDWDISINYGIKTGFNEAFIIDKETKERLIAEDPKSAEILKPLLRGRDIKRYNANYADLWLIDSHNGYTKNGKRIERIHIEDYPAIKNHLDKYWEALEKRYDKGDTPYNLRNCAYMEDFEKEKVVWKEMGSKPSFTFDNYGYLSNDTTTFLVGKNVLYLLASLNSKLLFYIFSKQYAGGGLGSKGIRFKKNFLEAVPVLKPTPTQETQITDLVNQILVAKKQDPDADTQELEDEIDHLVYKLYGLTYDEVLIVDPETKLTREEYGN